MEKTKTYDQQTAKFIAVVVQNLPDLSNQAMQAWIENPSGLKRVLTSVLCPVKKKKIFEKFITIKLGAEPKNRNDFYHVFSHRGIKVEQWARKILDSKDFTVADKEREVDLVNVTTFELGLNNLATREEIYNRAKKLGLELCPAEVGPRMALQHKGRYEGEWIIVGMEPVLLSDGVKELFSVKYDNLKMILCAHGGKPEELWNPEQQWLFVLPRK
jgi:hypothetical protein